MEEITMLRQLIELGERNVKNDESLLNLCKELVRYCSELDKKVMALEKEISGMTSELDQLKDQVRDLNEVTDFSNLSQD